MRKGRGVARESRAAAGCVANNNEGVRAWSRLLERERLEER
jgi:hypothetical protein